MKTFRDREVYEEVEADAVPAGARIIGTTVVLVPKGPGIVKGRICAQDYNVGHRSDVYSPTPLPVSMKKSC